MYFDSGCNEAQKYSMIKKKKEKKKINEQQVNMQERCITMVRRKKLIFSNA